MLMAKVCCIKLAFINHQYWPMLAYTGLAPFTRPNDTFSPAPQFPGDWHFPVK